MSLRDEDGGDEANRQVTKSLPSQKAQPTVLLFDGRIQPEADRQGAQDDDEVPGDLAAEIPLIIRRVAI